MNIFSLLSSVFKSPSNECELKVDFWGLEHAGKTVVLSSLYSNRVKRNPGKLTCSDDLRRAIGHIASKQAPQPTPNDNINGDNGGVFSEWMSEKLTDDKTIRLVAHAGQNFSKECGNINAQASRVQVLVANPFVLDDELAKNTLLKTISKLQKKSPELSLEDACRKAAKTLFHGEENNVAVEQDSITPISLFCSELKNILSRLGGVNPGITFDYESNQWQVKDGSQKDCTPRDQDYTNLEKDLSRIFREFAQSVTGDKRNACSGFIQNLPHAILVLTHLDIFEYLNEDANYELERIVNILVDGKKEGSPNAEIRNDLDGRIIRLKTLVPAAGNDTNDHKGFCEKPLGLDHLWRAIIHQHDVIQKETSPASVSSFVVRLWWTFLPTIGFITLLLLAFSTVVSQVGSKTESIENLSATLKLPIRQQIPYRPEFVNAHTDLVVGLNSLKLADEGLKEATDSFPTRKGSAISVAETQNVNAEKMPSSTDAEKSAKNSALSEAKTALETAEKMTVENDSAIRTANEKRKTAEGNIALIRTTIENELSAMNLIAEEVEKLSKKSEGSIEFANSNPSPNTGFCFWMTFVIGSFILFALQMLTLVVHGPRLFAELRTLFTNHLAKHRFGN